MKILPLVLNGAVSLFSLFLFHAPHIRYRVGRQQNQCLLRAVRGVSCGVRREREEGPSAAEGGRTGGPRILPVRLLV
jgi:hypothetical protein